jgi:hypothetical protein
VRKRRHIAVSPKTTVTVLLFQRENEVAIVGKEDEGLMGNTGLATGSPCRLKVEGIIKKVPDKWQPCSLKKFSS